MILYSKPNDVTLYKRWYDNNDTYDIWYKDEVRLYDYQNLNIPNELKLFLDKWNNKINEYKKTYKEQYPVKLACIEFIYKDEVYVLYPLNLSCYYKSNFMSEEEYEVSWDSLFEEYEREIRDDLEKELGVIHSRYYGMLD